MAGQKPSFITGANAKIKAGDITLAYAQDVSYSAATTTIPIETMGRYEVVANEPVAYFVDGTLTVIRYTNIAKGNNMDNVADDGNGTGNWDFATGGKASDHMNPGDLLASTTWDLDIFQKFDQGGSPESQKVIKLIDCRFTRKAGAVSKRNVLTEQFTFNARFQEDDSYTHSGSGDDDLA